MRVLLRWKILFLAVLAPLVLGLAALNVVNRRVSAHVRTTVDENLTRSSLVCDEILKARARALESSAHVVSQDPRFLSVMALAASARGRQVRATMEGVARDFNLIARADLFEVLDADGRLVASIGRDQSDAERRSPVIGRSAAQGSATGLLSARNALLQVAAVQVIAGGRRVGTLLVGLRTGDKLAAELGSLTRSQVAFSAGPTIAGDGAAGSIAPGPAPRSSATTGDAEVAAGVDHVVELDVHGARFLSLSRPIPGAEASVPARYVLRRSLDQEMAFLGLMQRELGGLGLVILLAAVAFGLLVSVAITRPVRALVKAAEQMERGNYDSPLDVKGRDEIGYLAERFREMRLRERDYVKSLEEVARMKSDFIAVASHEIRTPVTLIKAYGELFWDESLGPVTEEQRKALDVIQQNADTIVRITDDASSMASLEGERPILHREVVDLDAVVREAVAAAAADGPQRQVALAVELDPPLGSMWVDGARLGQAIGHLTRNAIRFTPDGGSIVVTGRRDHGDLCLEVRDSGIGIAEERQVHLFTRSFMVRDPLNHHSSSELEFNSEGLGLGLPIARGIVEAHGGSISVSSRLGEGSTFIVRIHEKHESEMQDAA